jgi:hypothetical protein
MPLETLSVESAELTAYLIDALWIVAGLCGIVVTFVLAFLFLAGRTLKGGGRILPDQHQFGKAAPRGASFSLRGDLSPQNL